MIYMPRPVTAIVLVRISLHRIGKNRLVMMMVSAGRLTISWTMSLLWSAKCDLITPSAGAMTAPAITVRREIERIVKVSFPFFLVIKDCVKD